VLGEGGARAGEEDDQRQNESRSHTVIPFLNEPGGLTLCLSTVQTARLRHAPGWRRSRLKISMGRANGPADRVRDFGASPVDWGRIRATARGDPARLREVPP